MANTNSDNLIFQEFFSLMHHVFLMCHLQHIYFEVILNSLAEKIILAQESAQ